MKVGDSGRVVELEQGDEFIVRVRYLNCSVGVDNHEVFLGLLVPLHEHYAEYFVSDRAGYDLLGIELGLRLFLGRVVADILDALFSLFVNRPDFPFLVPAAAEILKGEVFFLEPVAVLQD